MAPSDPHPTARAAAPWTSVLFPIALLLFGAFFFGGRIGWWSDDYWHNQRNPVTGAIDALAIHRGFFLRPLFYLIVPAVTTLSWNTQWPAHLLQVVAHGAVVVVLWRLLLALGASRPAAGAAALLFMLYPANFETLFWVSALPPPLASLVMLGMYVLTIARARGRAGLWAVPLLMVMAFVVCSLNEQPAAGIAAMPLIYWAARRPRAGTPTNAPAEPAPSTPHWIAAI